MFLSLLRKHKIVIIAIVLGIVILGIYVQSGQSSLDQNSRELLNSDSKVNVVNIVKSENGEKTLEIKCKNGSSYEVFYPVGETDFEALASSKCN